MSYVRVNATGYRTLWKLAGMPVILMLAAHAWLGVRFTDMCERIDYLLYPCVRALRFIGLNIDRPFITGAQHSQFFVVQCGIILWGAVIFNISVVALYLFSSWNPVRDPRDAQDYLKNKYYWSDLKAWGATYALIFFVVFPITSICLFGTLNVRSGWMIFTLPMSVPMNAAIAIFFGFFPATFVSPMLIIIAKYLACSGRALYKHVVH